MKSQTYGVKITRTYAVNNKMKGMKIAPLTYDNKVVKSLDRLRRKIAEIKRKRSRYNNPISEDNFL
ncbi:MAG: hypothetical protein ACE5GF_04600 [Thermodesulfobacteriota bacterium]